MRLGILPAAGKSERWAGYPKELLPISSDETFISRAVRTMQICGCHSVVVITSPSKSQLHAYHLKDCEGVVFAVQHGEELWGAITTAIDIRAEEYYFMMPDTYLPGKPFPVSLKMDFGIGVFLTDEPARFGVLRKGQVHDKVPGEGPGVAWGTLSWTRRVAEYWSEKHYQDHTSAINDAMRVFGYGTWDLDYYYDIGSMDYYKQFLLENPAGAHEPEQVFPDAKAGERNHAGVGLSDDKSRP
jgi:hypothetical protein